MKKKLVTVVIMLLFACPVFAYEHMLYGGAGISTDNNETAIVFGYLGNLYKSKFSLGSDTALESEIDDSTYNKNTAEDALSYNAVITYSLYKTSNTVFDLGFLLGAREKSRGCKVQSFIGFACYANADPVIDYVFNYGVISYIAYKNIALGVRATEVSQQMFIGLRF